MELYRSQRLRAFMDYLRSEGKVYNDTDFCTKLKKNRVVVSELVNGKRNITPQFVSDVRAVFPDLNPAWLMEKGCTSMLLGQGDPEDLFSHAPEAAPSESSDIVRLHKIIEKQQATIDRLLQIIERMQDGKGND